MDKRMDEAAANIVGLYQRHGDTWAALRGDRLYEGAWLERFLRVMGGAGTVLDLGCGSGRPMARYLAGRGCTVTGVDSAPGMIARAAADFPKQEWIVADMRGLALGRRFGGILAWDSFFHLCPADQRAMFAVFRAHAAVGAALMFTSGPAHGVALGVLEGEVLYHASLDPDEYRAVLAAHGFAVVAHVAEDAGCGGRTVWLARAGAAGLAVG